MHILKRIISNEKDLTIIKNIISSFLIKGGALLVSFFSMPAYINYFENQTVLGVWFTILSVMIWILSFDFGIGNGLRNNLVGAILRNDKQEIKEYISSAYVVVGIIVTVFSLIGYALFPLVNWNAFFNIDEHIVTKKTLLYVVVIVFTGILINFILKILSSILYALQKSAITNLLTLITSVSQLVFVLLAPSSSVETNLILFSIAHMLCLNVPLLIGTIVIFKKTLKGCAPKLKFFTKKRANSVLKLGVIFFWVQSMYMIIAVTNEFFISQFTKPEYVVDYQIYNRLFTIVGMLFSLALTPIWSAITKAINEKDYHWLQSTYKKLNILVLLALSLEFTIIPFLQVIVDIWLGRNYISINYIYASIFAMYGSIFIYLTALSTIVSGMGKLKLQAVCYTIGVFIKYILIYYGSSIFESWIVVIASNAVILLPYCILQAIFIKRDLKLMSKGEYRHV